MSRKILVAELNAVAEIISRGQGCQGCDGKAISNRHCAACEGTARLAIREINRQRAITYNVLATKLSEECRRLQEVG